MNTDADLLISALWLASKVIFVGTTGRYLVTIGNPRELQAEAKILQYLHAAPPTAIFRWRPPQGYEVVVYRAATDEEEVKPALFQPIWWSPTYLLWPKSRPQPREVMLRAARLAFLMRFAFFVCFYLGGFCLLGWLAFTESPRWLVALAVLAIDQHVFAHTDTYFVWLRWWLFTVIGIGAWVYLQGGAFESIAICAVGGLIVVITLYRWYWSTTYRYQQMRDMESGPFNPSRARRLR